MSACVFLGLHSTVIVGLLYCGTCMQWVKRKVLTVNSVENVGHKRKEEAHNNC